VDISDLIAPEGVMTAASASGKAQLLRVLSQTAGKALGIDPRVVLRALQAREELGSTGVGQSVAIPHCTLPGLGRFFGLFARLTRPIEFQAIDGQPVDLVFLLLIPEQAGKDHLTALALISRCLRDRETAARLRAAADEVELYQILTGSSGAAAQNADAAT
jgi:nitrogen PTS system EIIA component